QSMPRSGKRRSSRAQHFSACWRPGSDLASMAMIRGRAKGISFTSVTVAAVLLLGLPAFARATSTTVVSSGTDGGTTSDGTCTLREAVIEANTNVPITDCIPVTSPDFNAYDTIEIDSSVGTVTLNTTAGNGEDSSQTGDLDVLGDLKIQGMGGSQTTISAGANPTD